MPERAASGDVRKPASEGLARAVSSDLADTSCCNTLIYILDSFIRAVTNPSFAGLHYYWSKIASSYQLGGKVGIRKTTYFPMPSRSEIQLFSDPKTGPKMTTLERAYIAIRIYPQIVATRFSPKNGHFWNDRVSKVPKHEMNLHV